VSFLEADRAAGERAPRFDRFQRGGIAACRSKWRLICLTHNVTKLHRHQLILTTA
jgi:hypothetical protein